MDHAGGAGALARRIPGVEIIVHERGAKHVIDPGRLVEATRLAFGDRFEDDYGPILPVPETRVRAVMDGETIQLGDRQLTVVYAPGHATHQICIYDAKTRAVFSGEALGTPGSREVAAVAGFDPDSALDTVDRLGRLSCRAILCSHGGAISDVARHLQSVRANMKAYGDMILAGLKAGEGEQAIAGRLETRLPRTRSRRTQGKEGAV